MLYKPHIIFVNILVRCKVSLILIEAKCTNYLVQRYSKLLQGPGQTGGWGAGGGVKGPSSCREREANKEWGGGSFKVLAVIMEGATPVKSLHLLSTPM